MTRSFMLSFFVFFISGCATAERYEALDLVGKSILLDVEGCFVTYKGQKISAGMSGNCFFIKESNSTKIHTKYYKDIASHVVLIVGDSLARSSEYPLTKTRDDCGATVKALLVNDREVLFGDKQFTNTVTCAGIGSDEKEFYILSH